MKSKSFFTTYKTSFFLGLYLILWGCNSSPQNDISINESNQICVENYDAEKDYFPEKVNPEYAKGFQVEYQNHYKKVTVKQPWENANQNLDYIFVQCGTPIPTDYADATIVEIPTNRIVAMSTTYLPHIEHLDSLDELIAVGDRRLIYSEVIRGKIDEGLIGEVGDLQSDHEKVLGLQPDVILSYRLENSDSSGFEILESLGIKIVLDAAHLEPTPLGRAEWLKFTALLLNKEAEANTEFAAIAIRYQDLQNKLENVTDYPKVVTGSPFQGIWYSPGGNSYVAQLFRDVKTVYSWNDTESRFSIPLDFETVLNKAQDADIWVNVNPAWKSIEDMLNDDNRYGLFAPVDTGKVYAANARVAADGGNDYWEGGVINPDIILADLIKIIHPDLLPDHQLYYYRQLD